MLVAGDRGVFEDGGELILAGDRGPLARWPLPPSIGAEPATSSATFTECACKAVALADPPRLAVRVGDGRVAPTARRTDTTTRLEIDRARIDVIDVATGAVEKTIVDADEAPAASLPEWTSAVRGLGEPLAFTPDGDALFITSSEGLVLVGAAASGAPRTWSAVRDVDQLTIARDGAAAICWHSAHASLALVEWRGAASVPRVHRVRVRNVAVGDGALLVANVTIAGSEVVGVVSADEAEVDSIVQYTPLARLWCNRAVSRVVGLSDDGELGIWAAHRPNARLVRQMSLGTLAGVARVAATDVHVDVDRDVVVVHGRGVAHLRGLTNKRSATRPAQSVVIGGTGVAVVLERGALYTLAADGGHLLDGPGAIVSIAPHPRGVVARDQARCVHVVEVS